MSRRIILLRHGQTEYNATKRMQGQLDTELADAGRHGARNAANALRDAGVTRIIASDLQRAVDTAQAAADVLGLEVTTDARLRETMLGQWQGLTHSEVDAQYPGARAAWRADATFAPPGGESRLDVSRRARPVIDELGDADETVLIVAHGGTICALTGSLLGFDVAVFPSLGTLSNTQFGVLDMRGDRYVLKAWNVAEVPA